MWCIVKKKIDFINSVEQNGLDNSMYFKINKFSRSRNSEVRNRIAQALNGTGDKEYIEILMRLMNDDDEIVRARRGQRAETQLMKWKDIFAIVRKLSENMYTRRCLKPPLYIQKTTKAKYINCFCRHMKRKNLTGQKPF